MRRLGVILLISAAFRVNAAEVAREGSHVFYSSFWISLHERLRHEAIAKTPEPHDFNESERAAWDHALATYRSEVASRSELDADLVRWVRALVKSADAPQPSAVPDSIASALQFAAPVYRKYDWPDDDRVNRFSISVATTLLRETEAEIAKELARLYGVKWPASLHFEITPFAERVGAYTPDPAPDMMLTVMSSRHANFQGFRQLEMLFHEPLHHFDARFDEYLNAAAKTTKTTVPPRLAHMILFYTSGEVVQRALAKRGVQYTPAALALNMYQRPNMRFLPHLENDWQMYLDGKLNRHAALEQLLRSMQTAR